MTQLQEIPTPSRLGGEHRRPVAAFVLVALVCGLVFGNALRSEALRSVLRFAVDNIVSSSSLVHERADRSPSVQQQTGSVATAATITDNAVASVVPGTRPGLAKGHAKGKTQGQAKGHHKAHPGLAKGFVKAHPGKALGHQRKPGAGAVDRTTGHARATQGGHARGHSHVRGEGKAHGHGKDRPALGHARR